MTDKEGPSFRDFAAAIGDGDIDAASGILAQLLELDVATATASAEHFQKQMAAVPDFVMKAMGLRYAVTGGTKDEVVELLTEIFDLKGDIASAAANAVIRRFKSQS